MTMPASTQFLGPILTEFLQNCAGVQLDVVLTDQLVDLVEESFDIAIRAGELEDSTLVSRKLGVLSFAAVASPRYLSGADSPTSRRSSRATTAWSSARGAASRTSASCGPARRTTSRCIPRSR